MDSKNVEKNKEQWIKIAEGGDGYNTTWYDEFAPVMQQIERYLYAIDEHQLDLNWEEICNSVPALHDKGWHISKDRPWEEFTECLEYRMDCFLRDEVCEDGMPGQSGHFFTLELKASKKKSFLTTMGQLLSSLENIGKRIIYRRFSSEPTGSRRPKTRSTSLGHVAYSFSAESPSRRTSRGLRVYTDARTNVVLINVLKDGLTFTLVQFRRIRPGKTIIEYIFNCQLNASPCIDTLSPV